MRSSPTSWCLAAAALFGASTPAAKYLLDAMGPVLLAGLLYAGATLFALPSSLKQRSSWKASKANKLRLAGAAVFGGIVGPLFYLWGLSLAPAGAVSLWLTLETVATALLARFLFREHLGSSGWIAVALVCASSILLSAQLNVGFGALLVALGCVCWGLDNNWTSLIDDYSPAQITVVKGVSAAVLLIPLGLTSEPLLASSSIVGALSIGALGYGLSLSLYVAGAQQLGAIRSQLLFSTAPLFGLVPSLLWLSEPLTAAHIAATLIMAFALYLLQRQSHAHPHLHPTMTHTHLHRHEDGHHQHQHKPGDPPLGVLGWHQHPHRHERAEHSHSHVPDLHHRHDH